MDVKGFLGGGKAEKKKTRNADQIRGAKAVGRRRVLCAEKKARRQEEQEQSKTRTTKKMKSGKLMCYNFFATNVLETGNCTNDFVKLCL